MTLTPLQKFIIIAAALVVQGMIWFWAAAETDFLALGIDPHLFHVLALALAALNSVVTLTLTYRELGLLHTMASKVYDAAVC